MGGRGSVSKMMDTSNEERKKERKKINDKMTEFPDKAEKASWFGSMQYEGDGKEQVKFFKDNSNAYQTIDNMSREEVDAFQAWTRGSFMTPSVWNGWDNMDSSQQRYTRIYDRILDNATLSKGLIVNRLADAHLLLGKKTVSSLSQLRSLEGNLLTVKSFMSCGAASEGLHIGDTKKNVQLRIHIPSGSKGAGMWVGHEKINGWGVRQREFMTNRDIVVRIGKSTYDSSSGVYTVNVYYESRTAHDYGKR